MIVSISKESDYWEPGDPQKEMENRGKYESIDVLLY